jgi:hypothetical protein
MDTTYEAPDHIFFPLRRSLFLITQYFLAKVFSNTNNVLEIWTSHGGGHEDYFLLKKYRSAACLICPNISEKSLASIFGVEETCIFGMD